MEILHLEDLGDTSVISECSLGINLVIDLFGSAVPSGSGAFQMPTCPSSTSASSVVGSLSTLRGEGGGGRRANLRNISVNFSIFWHEASLG